MTTWQYVISKLLLQPSLNPQSRIPSVRPIRRSSSLKKTLYASNTINNLHQNPREANKAPKPLDGGVAQELVLCLAFDRKAPRDHKMLLSAGYSLLRTTYTYQWAGLPVGRLPFMYLLWQWAKGHLAASRRSASADVKKPQGFTLPN